MDTWNPIIGKTYVKPVPFWQLCLAFVVGVALLIVSLWGTTVGLFSLVTP